MKKVTLRAVLFAAIISVFSVSCKKSETQSTTESSSAKSSQSKTSASSAATIIAAMGTGFNLGNTFDKSQNSTNPDDIKKIIDLYYNQGLRHVRIPVTWMDSEGFSSRLADANGNINTSHSRLSQLKSVTDYALGKGMYVVINTHHEFWLKDNYTGSSTYNTKFTTLWKGIANHFKYASERLLFQVLNEPEGKFGTSNATSTQDALTRQINKVGYDAIRSTGGNNSTRVILIAPNQQGNHSRFDNVYPTKSTLPGGGTSSYLAIDLHTYDPWSFCGPNGSLSGYPGTTSLINNVIAAKNHSNTLGVPVQYGEFGMGRDAQYGREWERNTTQAREYYRTLRNALVSRGMAGAVWDDRGWYKLIQKNSSGGYSFVNNLVPNMMQ